MLGRPSGRLWYRERPGTTDSGWPLHRLVIIQRLDDGQRFDVLNTSLSQHLATTLKLLFDEETHANKFSTSLSAQVQNGHARIAISQEVINEQYTVVGSQVFATNHQRTVNVFSKRVYRRDQRSTHRRWLLLLGKHHGQLHQIA